MYSLMIVEDDFGIAEAIKEHAETWNIKTHIVRDFQNILKDFAEFQPNIVLIDIALPFYNGFYWCSEIRKFSNVPIIFISSASDNMNMIMAMNMGADDFISKPFDQSVLMAKIQALLRRAYDYAQSAPILEHKGVILNTGDNSITYKDKSLSLSKNEYRIMQCLMENRGKTVSREKLMQRLWKTEVFVDDNTLTVNVNRLRRRLEKMGLKDFIKTKFGVGYIID